jgi:hypothetical protein
MDMAEDDDSGLHWGDEPVLTPEQPDKNGFAPVMPYEGNQSAAVETTAYAMLALIEHGDSLSAGRAGQWLVAQRNAFGGFASTQDTVVGLQALTAYAGNQKADVDLTVSIEGPGVSRWFISPRITLTCCSWWNCRWAAATA